jgi:hypothetical protein
MFPGMYSDLYSFEAIESPEPRKISPIVGSFTNYAVHRADFDRREWE